MNTNGKGDRFRPKTVDYKTWDKNWQNIFDKKEKNSRVAVDKPITDVRMKENQSRD